MFKQEIGVLTCNNHIKLWNRKSFKCSLLQVPNNIPRRWLSHILMTRMLSILPFPMQRNIFSDRAQDSQALVQVPLVVLAWLCEENFSHEVAPPMFDMALRGFP